MTPFQTLTSPARLTVLVACALAAGCMNTGTTEASNGPFYSVSASIADSTKFPAGSTVLVRASVTHQSAAVFAAAVGWAVTAGGGTVSAATTSTDTLGQSSVVWTLGDNAGVNTLIIGTTDGADTVSVIGEVGDPSYVQAVGLDSTLTAVGASATLQARVTDATGNNVPGVPISWTTIRGTLSAAVVPSDANGISTVTFSATAPGNYFITAELAGRASHIFHVLVQ